MLNFTETLITETPTGRFTFVGRVPVALHDLRPATKADVFAGRTVEAPDGSLWGYHCKSFATRAEAEAVLAEYKASNES
jgi:hypothetical protein